jgi:anti-anti-sigma regulatory factor
MAEQTESFRIEVQEKFSRDLLVLAGAVVNDAAVDLQASTAPLPASSRNLAIDWRDADHVSAAAVGALLALALAVSRSGRKCYVAADNPAVRRSLEVAGLSGPFPAADPRA